MLTLSESGKRLSREQSTTCIPFDLPRTFPTLAFFDEGGPLHNDCARILEALELGMYVNHLRLTPFSDQMLAMCRACRFLRLTAAASSGVSWQRCFYSIFRHTKPSWLGAPFNFHFKKG